MHFSHQTYTFERGSHSGKVGGGGDDRNLEMKSVADILTDLLNFGKLALAGLVIDLACLLTEV